jgi:SAM-dependent methyltransferase
MSNSTADSYDAVPFFGGTVAHAHPEFMETVAGLRGMRPARAAGARVLELGCGVGGNLLPMAERYPAARFLGIDLAERQITMAQDMARQCSLANIEFRRQDIRELGRELGQFDYIISHGVYSWVEAAVRDKLLAVCRDLLAPQGVVYVGYKTYPGWHTNDAIRQAMLEATRTATTPQEQIARSRSALAFLQASLPADDPRATAMRSELEQLARLPDDYLWHEYLESVNYPVYFRQFVEHARAHRLAYLGDGALGIRWAECLPAETERRLAAITGDRTDQETLRDILVNRSFRQTLLCHEGLALADGITPSMLRGLYLEGQYRPENGAVDFRPGVAQSFVHGRGGRITTSHGLLKAALAQLGEQWPAFVRYEDLLAAASRRLETAGMTGNAPPEVAQLEQSLVDCCLRPVVLLHSHGELFATRPSAAPVASSVARMQAGGRGEVANRRHEPVPLNPLDRWLLVQLDGQVSAGGLVERAAAAWAAGRLVVSRDVAVVASHDEARRFFDAEVGAALARLAEAALLVK